MRSLSSPGKGVSFPPLKKKVTCAYFSVSLTLNCLTPARERTSPRMFFMSWGLKRTGRLSLWSYSVMQMKETSAGLCPRSKPSKSRSTNALVISLALSALKLKKKTASFSSTFPTGRPFSTMAVGVTNSSVSPSEYASFIARTGSSLCLPCPFTIASYAFPTRSHLLSLSIA